jgi:hypothetical protein
MVEYSFSRQSAVYKADNFPCIITLRAQEEVASFSLPHAHAFLSGSFVGGKAGDL